MTASHCQQCGKAFNFFSCYRYPCVGCGGTFCLSCLSNLTLLTPADIVPPAKVHHIRDFSRPQKTCGECYVRVSQHHNDGSLPYSAGPNSPHPLGSKGSLQDDYTLGQKLGEGGFGLVKEAVQNNTGNVVAIKIINRSKLGKTEDASVLSEAKILSSLDHPNIVKLYEFYIEPANYFMVMEKVLGGELFDRIVEKSHYTEREARDLVTLVLHALKYLHDRDIVHRDLKPENLLLTDRTDSADVKLVDFGFATEAKTLSLTDQCGTPAYVAPEILSSQPYGKPVDMWSFGVILYILLVGYPPFFDNDQQVLFRKIMKGSFEFHTAHWRHISFAAKNLISGLLTVNPLKRFTVDDALAHEWLQVGSNELAQKQLNDSLVQLKKFQAAKKFKTGIKAVMAAGRLKRALSSELPSSALTPTSANAASKLPYTFNARYSLTGKVLGEGGYAIVKLGVNNITKDEVAVKVFTNNKMSASQVKGLKDEVEIMKQLVHPNIVKFYDFFEELEKSYVIMEKINGGELFDRIIRKQHYNENEAQQLARILLNAIKHMHDRNIVHRDLKPENLLMTSDSSDADIKVVDFGFAALVNGYSLDKYCGTPGYMAPEIIRRQLYGKPVDMWAFGVILYILLGGYPPFYDKNDTLLAQKICRGRFEFHPDCWNQVSNDAKDLIAHLLIVNADARYTVEDALRHRWLQEDEMILQERQLSRSLTELRKFQARRKFRAGLRAVHAVTRVKLLTEKSRSVDLMDIAGNSFEFQFRQPAAVNPYEEEFAMDVDDYATPPPVPQLDHPPLPPAGHY